MEYALDPMLPPRPFRPRSRFERSGLAPEHERWFNYGMAALVSLFVLGWSYTLIRTFATGEPPPLLTSSVTTSPLSLDAPPEAAFLLDAAMRGFTSRKLRGESGALRVIVGKQGETLPVDSLPPGVELRYGEGADTVGAPGAPQKPGVWNVLVAMKDAVRPVSDIRLVTLVPLSEKRSGRIGSYVIGTWPYERGGQPRSAAYAPPSGLIRVTPENMNTQVSEHFRLRDFLTKGQQNVWPKYVAMSPRLLDKLELTIQELERTGTPVKRVGIISGFRTPTYNESGGSTGGRGALSRHMYGDAMDFYVDNDGNGRMDDLNKDGRIDKNDGRVIGRAAEAVEKKYPELIGGIGLYSPTGAHGGFVHIDTRGYRARW